MSRTGTVPFSRIEKKGQCGHLLVAGAQHVGGADIAGADRADIAQPGRLRQQQAKGNGAAEIAEHERDDHSKAGQGHFHLASALASVSVNAGARNDGFDTPAFQRAVLEGRVLGAGAQDIILNCPRQVRDRSARNRLALPAPAGPLRAPGFRPALKTWPQPDGPDGMSFIVIQARVPQTAWSPARWRQRRLRRRAAAWCRHSADHGRRR